VLDIVNPGNKAYLVGDSSTDFEYKRAEIEKCTYVLADPIIVISPTPASGFITNSFGSSKITTDIAAPVDADVGVYTVTVTQDISGFETRTSTMSFTVTVSAANDCASTSFDNVDLDDVYGNHDSDFSVSIPTITNSAGSCGDQSISVKYSGASVSWA
jgi:hypothetical protein